MIKNMRVVCTMDADRTHNPLEIKKLLTPKKERQISLLPQDL